MPENDFEKTVKLTSTGNSTSSAADKTSQIPTDQTMKINSAEDKTIQLTSGIKTTPTPPKPTTTASLIPPPSIPDNEANNKNRFIKFFSTIVAVLITTLGGTWYLVPNFLKNKANELSQQNQPVQAAQKLKIALYFYPLHAETYLLQLGQNYRKANDHSNAQKTLEKLLKKDPNSVLALKEIGISFNESGQKQRAIESFKKILTMNPNDMQIVRWAGQLHFEMKNYTDAIIQYTQLQQNNQAEASDLYSLAASYFETKKYLDAEKIALTTIEKNSNLKTTNELLAKIYIAQEKWVEAVQQYQKAIQLNPEEKKIKTDFTETAQKAGEIYLAQKNWEGAISILESALSVPSEIEAVLNYDLAKAFAMKKNTKNVIHHLNKAIQKDPTLKTQAKKDIFFKSYLKNPQFKKIIF